MVRRFSMLGDMHMVAEIVKLDEQDQPYHLDALGITTLITKKSGTVVLRQAPNAHSPGGEIRLSASQLSTVWFLSEVEPRPTPVQLSDIRAEQI